MAMVQCKGCKSETPEHDTLLGYCLVCAAERIEELEKIIERFARHKPHCAMGEYNTIKIGKGCNCGLSEALKG